MELTTLSWMLLAADRADVITKFISIFFVISLIFVIVRGCIVRLDDVVKKMELKTIPWWAVVLLLGWGMPMILVALVPRTTVILQVAAIELGDDVLKSDEFQRILNVYIPREE